MAYASSRSFRCPISGDLPVPDGTLAVEVPEATEDAQVEARDQGVVAELQERLHDVPMDLGGEPLGIGGRAEVALGLADER
jgi:hypothetical protein